MTVNPWKVDVILGRWRKSHKGRVGSRGLLHDCENRWIVCSTNHHHHQHHGASPRADDIDHGVVGEAVVADIRVIIRSLRVYPRGLREVDIQQRRGHRQNEENWRSRLPVRGSQGLCAKRLTHFSGFMSRFAAWFFGGYVVTDRIATIRETLQQCNNHNIDKTLPLDLSRYAGYIRE